MVLQMENVYTLGVKEGWLSDDNQSAIVNHQTIITSGQQERFLSWRNSLQLTNEMDCYILISRAPVFSLLAENYKGAQAIKLGSKKKVKFPIHENEKGYLSFLSKDLQANRNSQFCQFYLREEQSLCFMCDNLYYIKKSIRQIQELIFRELMNNRTCMEESILDEGPLSTATTTSEHYSQEEHSSVSLNKFSYILEEKVSEDTIKEVFMEKPIEPSQVITEDLNTGERILEQGRKIQTLTPLVTGLALGSNIVAMSGLIGKVIIETIIDHNYIRYLLLLAVPFLMLVSQFLWESLINCICQLFLPVRQLHENSLYYSGKQSEPLPLDHPLPTFTIHMPCYKEGLNSVLAPSLQSVQKAVEAYKAVGGVANIIISEDGLRASNREEALDRLKYYNANDLGWVARPKDGSNGEYQRKGRFKKASNLNFTYNFSLRVEQIMMNIRKQKQNILAWTATEEEEIYQESFKIALEESEGKVWASGNIRIGDYVLLIDSDTRVPLHCLIEAAAELERSPEVGALQHCSGVMYVQNHYFERFIGYFTSCCINFNISWVCANGGVAPLMGHNVFLRWRAVQEVAETDTDGEVSFFSPSHVSEDFELAMKLFMKGYIVRWATYSNSQFTEGVSLAPADEVARLQKYAYGCSEIIFHPLRLWPTHGPFSKLFKTFLWSDTHLHYKIGVISYLSTYYALGTSFPLSIALFCAQAFFAPYLDSVFLFPIDVWVNICLVFTLGGAIGLIAGRARCGHATLSEAIKDHMRHLPALCIFFSGLAFHIMTALISHMCSIHMSWGSTNKDFTTTTMRELIKKFWAVFLTSFFILLAIISSMTALLPIEWRTEGFVIVGPILFFMSAHLFFPVLLDPGLLYNYLPNFAKQQTPTSFSPDALKTFFFAAGERQRVYFNDRKAFQKDECRMA